MADLYFSQQHLHTQMGPSVPIHKTPHFLFMNGKRDQYRDYLRRSWKSYRPHFSESDIEQQVKRFDDLIADVKRNGIKRPIMTFTRPNGDLMIYDGNHRSAIGKALGIEIPADEISLVQAIRNRVDVGSFYGTKHRGMPYQTIYAPDGTPVVEGRRDDLITRNDLISQSDVTGKTVVDVGCNYGNALLLLRDARRRIGIDVDEKILTAAVRMAVIFNQEITFKAQDMSVPNPDLPECDTAFVFSVDAHLNALDGLVEFIKEKVRTVVYFETHEGRGMPLPPSLFRNVEQIGVLPGERKLLRCTK